MRNLLFLLIVSCFLANAGEKHDIDHATDQDRADCELSLSGEGRFILLHTLLTNLTKIDKTSVFARISAGVKPSALRLFNIDPDLPQIFSFKLAMDSEGKFDIEVHHASRRLVSVPLEGDPAFIWKQMILAAYEEYTDAGQRPRYDLNQFQELRYNGYSYGNRVKLETTQIWRFAAIQHVDARSVRIALGLDMPCAMVENYLEDGFAPVYVMLPSGPKAHLCRIGVMTADFELNSKPSSTLILVPASKRSQK